MSKMQDKYKPFISIIIPCRNEQNNLDNTIKSILEGITVDDPAVQIVVVDDGSQPALNVAPFPCIDLIRNKSPMGVSASRRLGAEGARADYLMHIDCHMIFPLHWIDWIPEELEQDSLCCANCVVNHSSDKMLIQGTETRSGATLNLSGPDPANGLKQQQMEAVWIREATPALKRNFPEVPCVMGACYIMSADLFWQLDPLRHLRSWGSEEIMLSLKTWLYGGSVRVIEKLSVGHIFRRAKSDKLPYKLNRADIYYNKAFAARTLLPPDLAETVIRAMPQAGDAAAGLQLLDEHRHIVDEERERNEDLFSRDFEWFREKFDIPLPHA